jgi:hypothetical protein
MIVRKWRSQTAGSAKARVPHGIIAECQCSLGSVEGSLFIEEDALSPAKTDYRMGIFVTR